MVERQISQVTAARWLVAAEVASGLVDGPVGGTAVPVDVVGHLLAFDPRTRLRGRGGDRLRSLAAVVETLVTAAATTVAGVPLVEVLVEDPDERAALAPSWDLDALLGGEVGRPTPHDRTIRLAEAMTSRADAHRRGDVDLVGLVAPPGVGRHPCADELEATVRVALDGAGLAVVAEPAVVVHPDGWVGVSPLELFLLAGTGVADGRTKDLAGSALASWLAGADARDPWLAPLTIRTQVDTVELLDQASSRAGSDHPDVVAPIVMDLVRMRHPSS